MFFENIKKEKLSNEEISDIIFYDDLIGSNWEYVKEKYINV